jgi:very-short-patch-repair endonuclease
MKLSDFDDWARAHHGIITFEASGLTRATWYREIERGTLIQVHPGVARLVGTPDTPEQRIIAGLEAIGEPALASHRSAARLWGVPRPDDDPVDVLLTAGRRDVQLDDVIIHRSTDRAHLTPQKQYGISCTNILRTLLDLGAVDPSGVHPTVGHAVTHRLASLEAIEAAASEHARRGRGGIVAVRDAIADWSIDDKPADSILEVVMRRLIDRFDLPPVEFHPVIEGYEVDFRVIDAPVILECDGWAYHGLDRANFERDRDRDADLIAAGWVIVRFTYRGITTRQKATADRIRAACDRWSPESHDVSPHPPDAA